MTICKEIKSLTLDECLKNKPIINYWDTLDIKYKNKQYSISVGDKFNRLTVKKLVQYMDSGTKRKGCICECICGNYIGPSRLYMLLSGDLQSCGCYCRDVHSEQMKKSNTIHGQTVRGSRTKLYTLWAAMKDRATNTNREDVKYYALKDIGISQDWLNFETFRDWAVKHGYKDGLSIERKDNSIGYFPENCVFIEKEKQNSNKTNSRLITYKNETHTITEWTRITGKSWTYINDRLKNGKSVGEALGFEE